MTDNTQLLEVEEHVVELLIEKCKMNRGDANEVWKNHFLQDYQDNVELYRHCDAETVANGYVDSYRDEWC